LPTESGACESCRRRLVGLILRDKGGKSLKDGAQLHKISKGKKEDADGSAPATGRGLGGNE